MTDWPTSWDKAPVRPASFPQAIPQSRQTRRLVGVCSTLALAIGLLWNAAAATAPAEPTSTTAMQQGDVLLAGAQLTLDAPIRSGAPVDTPRTAAGPVSAGPAQVSAPSAAVAAPVTADLSLAPPPGDSGRPIWAVNVRETGLWSGRGEATLFNRVASGATFRVLEHQSDRFRVFFPGDRDGHLAGEAWVDAADLRAERWPGWVRLRRESPVLARPEAGAAALATVPAGSFVEVIGEASGPWAPVHYIGDGRRPAVDGWLESGAAFPLRDPDVIPNFALTRQRLAAGPPSAWITVPYRSQLDGSPYAAANCGPTTVNMVLESFGIRVAQPDLRRQILGLQPNENCDDCGTYIQNLAEVISRHGLKVHRLRDADPEAFHRWTIDEVRAELRAGHPVIPQVFYRGLPPRASSGYWGDHYIVLTGLLGDSFVYNDPIDAEGPGYARVISAEALEKAMGGSDYPFAAFSVSR